jgi:hypothetical protein
MYKVFLLIKPHLEISDMLFVSSVPWANIVHMFNKYSMKFFFSRRMHKLDKIRWEIDSVAIGQAMKDVINEKTKV